METPKEEILEFMSYRPDTEAIIGYGSGVKPQVGQENRKPQIDLIVVVDDMRKWHLQNMKKNPKDYSFSGKLFFRFASLNWIKAGGKICYMTYIPFNNRKFKIGTIERSDFLADLKNWETFYIAGRMQKPILIAKADETIESVIEYNRHAGVDVTKLIVDDKIEINDFYINLASLSYIGDTRMGIAENPDKVKNIVMGNLDFYNDKYGTLLKISDGIVQNTDDVKKELLPDDLKVYLDSRTTSSKEEVINFLTEKNKSKSLSQTVKGIFTTGPIKSVKYAYEKLKRKKKK